MAYIYENTQYSANDISRRFNGSYVKLEKYGVVYITGFGEDYFVCNSAKHGTLNLPPKEFVVESPFPDTGVVVNYRKSCALIGRVPRRQWVAGLIQDTLSTDNPEGYAFAGRITSEVAEALFNPQYTSFEKAFTTTKSDPSIAIAFSPYYWMCNPNKEADKVKLYRKQIEIGMVESNGKGYVIALNDFSASLEQELKDEIKDVRFEIKQLV